MSTLPKKADVVIIGGGVNGCSLAYQLARKDLDVVLCERRYLCSGDTGRCGAGIRQQWSTRENVELAIGSIKIFEQLSKELQMDIGLRQGGYLIAVHNEKEMQQAEKNVALQKSLGLDVSILSPDEMIKVAPVLDPKGMRAVGATFCPTDGHADPFKTTYAYAQAAISAGAQLYKFTEVTGIRKKKNRVASVQTNLGVIETDTVVNVAGAYSKEIAAMLGVTLPNYPLRKEILVTERVKPLFQCMVISFTDGIYFSQQEEGQILGGIPVLGETPGYKNAPTFPFLVHMSRTLTRYAPMLRPVNVIRQWTGYYDMTPDARPILGEVNGVKGFLQCNGFSGHGFMLSPMATKLLTAYIVEGKSLPILENLQLSRFEKGSDIEREASVVG
ncbi:MAG: FAD-binding oxidoreductase [Methanobacteriota archaeon]